MDYTTQPLSFKIKKVARYTRLYGPRRTLAKVRGQYHMKKRFEALPPIHNRDRRGAHVGILGCGNFAYSNIAFYLQKNYGRVIRGTMDIDIHRAASLFSRYRANYYTDDAEEVLQDPEIDLLFIASNHASHAEYAIRALELGKCVHVEKPHAVTHEQLERLCDAMDGSAGQLTLGFNRPRSAIGIEMKRHLDSQSGAAMFNWFIAGHDIPSDHWYFREEEGGRILGNLCHWTDFVYQCVAPGDRYPISIRPTSYRSKDSDIAVTYVFGNGSIAAISFSAKGHTFEGVKERFAAHRGNVLVTIDDFRTMVVDVLDKKRVVRPFFRDHGHEAAIRSSYELVRPPGGTRPGSDRRYVWETGDLFLRTREALERDEVVVVDSPFERRQQPRASSVS